jgi:hypothetical protein
MFKNISILAIALVLSNAVQGAEIKCGREPSDQVNLSEQLFYDVLGTDRLYLHSGPSEKCLDKKLFVVPGDNLIAYAEYGQDSEWSYVNYLSKSGKDYNGWVLTKRLRFTGASGQNMTPDKFKFYEKAAVAAKKGKLGSPMQPE